MTGARTDYRHLERLRVRWAEVDMQKIVFNGHYLAYADTAVAGYWRALALPYHDTMQALEGDLYVRKATVEYFGSAQYDDMLDVGVRCARIGNSSLLFDAAVFRDDRRLVGVELVYVFADPATQTSRPVPAALRDVLDAFERGTPMVEMRVERGAGALRVQAVNRMGVEVGTASALRVAPGWARVDALAVLPSLRRSGIGRATLAALVDAARDDGYARIEAPAGADAFYAASGFAGAPPALQLTKSST